MEDLRKYEKAVFDYVGIKPEYGELKTLNLMEWLQVLGTREAIFYANTLGITIPTKNKDSIYLKEGQNVLVHELLHTAGFIPIKITEYLNEGFTQYTAEQIGIMYDLPVFPAYKSIMKYFKSKIIPNIPINYQDFAYGYAHARDKGTYFCDILWDNYKNLFTDKDEWGDDPYERFCYSVSSIMSVGNRHIEHICNKGIKRRKF